jgi:hypothetical protein
MDKPFPVTGLRADQRAMHLGTRFPETCGSRFGYESQAEERVVLTIYCSPYFFLLSKSVLRLIPRISAARVIL